MNYSNSELIEFITLKSYWTRYSPGVLVNSYSAYKQSYLYSKLYPDDKIDPEPEDGELSMKSGRSPAGRDAKKIKSGQNQQITQAFFAILDVILTSIHEPVLVLDAEFKVVRANHAFLRTFDVNADEVKGVTIYDLGNRQWDIPKLRELLENILPENSKFDNFELEHNFGALGHKILHLNAKWIFRDNNQTQFIFLAIADVTDREYNRRGLEQLVEKTVGRPHRGKGRGGKQKTDSRNVPARNKKTERPAGGRKSLSAG